MALGVVAFAVCVCVCVMIVLQGNRSYNVQYTGITWGVKIVWGSLTLHRVLKVFLTEKTKNKNINLKYLEWLVRWLFVTGGFLLPRCNEFK